MRALALPFAALLGGLAALLLTASPPALGQNADSPAYHIDLDPDLVVSHPDQDGKKGTYVTLHFKVRLGKDGPTVEDVKKDEIEVEEDGRPVTDLEILQPKAQGLTAVLAMDVSGSVAGQYRIVEARKAADVFLDKLDPRSDSGLIFFDGRQGVKEPPGRDSSRFAAHRALLHRLVEGAKPGGTTYLDDTAEGLDMLRDIPGRRAVVLMTDGVDLNSKRTQKQVIERAKAAHVPIFTIGIGDPGTKEPVTTVLVLDHSGSMAAKASDADDEPKIQALREAASRFLELMGPTAETTLMPFSSTIDKPAPFSSNKRALKSRIMQLRPDSGTLLYDATFYGVETLAASRRPGKKAVVVLTDGVDESPGSRRTDEDVIEAAKAAGVPLYMLGLGRAGEINEPVMKKMAKATGGEYFHAENRQKLYDIFEKLSIDLHDDGIDEQALQTLAKQTGGKYYPGRDASKLSLIYEELTQELESTYTVTYASRHPDDGTARKIDIAVVRGGKAVSDVANTGYAVHGVVVPEMDHRVYLMLLAVLAALLAAPAGLRRLFRSNGGH